MKDKYIWNEVVNCEDYVLHKTTQHDNNKWNQHKLTNWNKDK
jgi:hypothetical protein